MTDEIRAAIRMIKSGKATGPASGTLRSTWRL